MDVNEKYMLTVKEAAEYYNIGTKSLRRIVENGEKKFAVSCTNRVLKENLDFYVEKGYEKNDIGKKVFFRFVMMDRLIERNSFVDELSNDIDDLCRKYPFVRLSHYGFKENWQDIIRKVNKEYI